MNRFVSQCMLSTAFYLFVYRNMTLKKHVKNKISQSSPEVARKLMEIEQSLISKNKFVEALSALMKLATENLKDHQVWLLIGLVYTRMAFWKNAIDVLNTSIQLYPENNSAKQLMSLALFSLGRKDEACQLIDEVCRSDLSTGPQWMLRAYLHAHTSSDPMHAFNVASDWSIRFAEPLTSSAKPISIKDKSPLKKLKIGYVTADFREHSIAFFMEPVLKNHNSELVDVYVYSNGPEDKVTVNLKNMVSNWFNVQHVSDESLCGMIRSHSIDILVDLSGYTHGHRLGVFARRAAPIQVTWLGYMHTLGMSAIDYRIVDAGITPPSHAKFYKENLFYVRCMASYVPPSYSPFSGDIPMQRNGYPTLISLNSSGKITDEALKVWATILKKRKDARLIILVKEQNADAAQASMQPRVEACGMPLDRVSVLHQQPLNGFMELGFIADIALDTFPISGGTTTLHTLWMGLPIVSLSGNRSVDSASSNTLHAVGLSDWVVYSSEQYIEKALYWMDNPELIKNTKKHLRNKLSDSPLMDYKSRVGELEMAFRIMWLNFIFNEKRCDGVLNIPEEYFDYLKVI